MSEENKKEPQAAAKQEKKPAPKPAAPSDKPHHLKVTQLSLTQVEEALARTQRLMGGFHSHYGRALLARKEFLTESRTNVHPKAA